MPMFGPTVYITYDESTGEYRIGESARGCALLTLAAVAFQHQKKLLRTFLRPLLNVIV